MKECRMCKSQINKDASICKNCGSDQRVLFQFIKNTGFINILSIAVLLLSFIQYNNAKKEKTLANEANVSAQSALKTIDSLSNHLQKLSKLYLDVSFITAYKGTLHADGGMTFPAEYSWKLDSLSRLIEPDKIKRKQWLNELRPIDLEE
jgi:hypothetical protein